MNHHTEFDAVLLDAFLDGELAEGKAAEVRAHLAACPACRRYVDDALAIRAAFPAPEDTPVPEGFAASVLAALPPRAPRQLVWKRAALPLAACAAVAVLAAAGIGLNRGRLSGGGMNGGSSASPSSAQATVEAAIPTEGGGSGEAAPESAEEESAAYAEKAPGSLTAERLEDSAPEPRSGPAEADAGGGESGAAEDMADSARSANLPEAQEGGGALSAGTGADSAADGLDGGGAYGTGAAIRRPALVLPRKAAPLLEAYAPVEQADGGAWYALGPDAYARLLDALEGAGIVPEERADPEGETAYVFLNGG